MSNEIFDRQPLLFRVALQRNSYMPVVVVAAVAVVPDVPMRVYQQIQITSIQAI
jgi:hypothetical protein